MQEATMSAPRMPIVCKKNTPRSAWFSIGGTLQRAPFFASFSPSLTPFLFFSPPRRAVPCRAGNSRGRRRNIFPWTWVRADMWNEARFAGWKLFNDRQNDRSHLRRGLLDAARRGSIVYISHFVPFHFNNQLVYDQSRVVYLLHPNRHSSLLNTSKSFLLLSVYGGCWV